MRFALPVLAAGLALLGPVRAAEPETYIFDVLALQPYKGNFAKLVKPKETPNWVKAISRQGEGLAGPMRAVDVGGTPYRLDRICKVGACAGNTIDVLWAPRGAKVWAAIVEGGKPPVMLGDPKGPQAKALADAAQMSSAGSASPAVAPVPPITAPPVPAPPPAPAAPN